MARFGKWKLLDREEEAGDRGIGGSEDCQNCRDLPKLPKLKDAALREIRINLGCS
jgi:hypothetical protein